jgi:hypothetical protein
LSPSGVLSYSTSEDGITRGSIQILVSSIAYSPKQRQIHVDSGTMLYHLKTLTEEDYEKWTNALRDFKANIEPEQDSHPPTPSATSSTSKRHSNFRQKQRSSGLPDLKLQVSRGIELSAQMQDIATTVMARVTLLQQLLTPDIANDDIKSVFAQLEKEKHVLLSNADEQLAQWHSIHACMNSSPNMSPCQKLTVPSESIHRTLSVSSRRSGYSDKFFDAEDIELSDGEEEEDGIIIDNNDSSDDESGDNAENGK